MASRRACNKDGYIRLFRLSKRCRWEISSSAMLRSTTGNLLSGVSIHIIGIIFKGWRSNVQFTGHSNHEKRRPHGVYNFHWYTESNTTKVREVTVGQIKQVYLFYFHNWIYCIIEVILCDLRQEGEEKLEDPNKKSNMIDWKLLGIWHFDVRGTSIKSVVTVRENLTFCVA